MKRYTHARIGSMQWGVIDTTTMRPVWPIRHCCFSRHTAKRMTKILNEKARYEQTILDKAYPFCISPAVNP